MTLIRFIPRKLPFSLKNNRLYFDWKWSDWKWSKRLRAIVYPLIFAFVALVVTPLLLYLTAPRVPILGFHGVASLGNTAAVAIESAAGQRMDYPVADMEKLLEYLVRNHYWFLSTQELYDFFVARSRPIPKDHWGQQPVMVSFDDSYKTVYTNLLPILQKLETQYGHKPKVVLFVNPGTFAKPNRPSTTYLSCQDLRDGYAKGFYDIQSHGQNHKKLTEISSADLTVELAQAQAELRQCMTGLAPAEAIATHIAYPYGAANAQVEAAAAKYYQSGFLYNSRILRFCWLKDRFRISRLTVNRNKTADRLIEMASRAVHLTEAHPC